jgi:hypothetical protein
VNLVAQAEEGQAADTGKPDPACAAAIAPPPEAETAAAQAETPEAAFRRRDGLWRAGLLGGRELLDHVEEKRRRGQYVNGLQRGFRTVLVPRPALEPSDGL